jgi:hypothetical protein
VHEELGATNNEVSVIAENISLLEAVARKRVVKIWAEKS